MRLNSLVAAAALLASVSLGLAGDPPKPPAWVSKDPSTWPPILLTNKVTEPNNAVGYSGSAAFVRLPNDVVVLMTAGHLLGDVKPADFAKGFKSWIAVAPPLMSASMKMTAIAQDTAAASPLDALVLLPASRSGPWPGTVLPVRQEPLQVGDVVYLIGIPAEGSKTRQWVHKGEITQAHAGGQFEYAVEGTFKTTGNSGAPVIDSQGRFAGINTSHLNDQTMPGKMQLVLSDVTAVMAEIKLPAGMKPLVLTTQPAAGNSSTAKAAPAASPGEADAEQKVAMIDAMIGSGQIPAPAARGMLQQIIDENPNTPAAAKAKAVLAKVH